MISLLIREIYIFSQQSTCGGICGTKMNGLLLKILPNFTKAMVAVPKAETAQNFQVSPELILLTSRSIGGNFILFILKQWLNHSHEFLPGNTAHLFIDNSPLPIHHCGKW